MKESILFGGDDGWHASDWTASDDRVRGGKSKSHLSCGQASARFYGNLDIQTLGGAGFASQRTASDDLKLDVSKYAGVLLDVEKGDDRRYTLILKDDLKPPDVDTGREQATISFECDFESDDGYDKAVFIPWDAFTPTYRGKPQEDAAPLDLTHIKRLSIMIRSFFGVQEGDFSITFKSISVVTQAPPPMAVRCHPTTDPLDLEAAAAVGQDGRLGWLRRSLLINEPHRRWAAYAILGLAAIAIWWHCYDVWPLWG